MISEEEWGHSKGHPLRFIYFTPLCLFVLFLEARNINIFLHIWNSSWGMPDGGSSGFKHISLLGDGNHQGRSPNTCGNRQRTPAHHLKAAIVWTSVTLSRLKSYLEWNTCLVGLLGFQVRIFVSSCSLGTTLWGSGRERRSLQSFISGKLQPAGHNWRHSSPLLRTHQHIQRHAHANTQSSGVMSDSCSARP